MCLARMVQELPLWSQVCYNYHASSSHNIAVTFMMDAGTHYSGNLGFKDPQAMVITSTNQWIIADKSNHRLIITDSTGLHLLLYSHLN